MKKYLLLTFVLGILPASARLGESLEQLTSRYGAPTSTSKKLTVFQKGPVLIMVTLWEGKCDSIILIRPENSPYTNDQIQALLDVNAGDSVWTGENKRFVTTDKKRSAFLAEPNTLMLETAECKARKELESARELAEENAKRSGLEGF